MIKALVEELADIKDENYINEQSLEWCANLILLRIEEEGVLPRMARMKKNEELS